MDTKAKQKAFQEWLKKVNNIVILKTGLDLLDLPDMDYFGMWERGVSPKSAATRAVRNANE